MNRMHSFITYAMRLGYTTEQAELAISRLGSDASTNDLLSLVISLNSSTSARRNDMKQRSGKKTNPRTRCLGYKLDKLSLVPVSSGVEGARELCSTASSKDVEILSE